jgi:hypothetical protein
MDLKTSLLVYNQLPEFIREEYPLFISFLESYYEFLESEVIVNGESQKNDLIRKLKDLKNISDVDISLSKFEEQFFNTFASVLPKETKVSKEFLIKNVLPLYKSKGTIKSFEFLFRILFNENINIEYPREQILKASDGKWVIENVIRTELPIYNQYVSDGIKSSYDLPYEILDIEIYVDDVFFDDYYIRKENKKIFFKTIPPLNSDIKIFYIGSFDTSIFASRQIKGLKSKSTAVVEKVGRRNLAGSNFYQFFIDSKNTVGNFVNGELIEIDVFSENGNIIPFYLQTFSTIRSVEIQNPGRDYQVGDSVIFRGDAIESAIAVVDDVSTGNIDSVSVKIGNFGAGFKVGNEVYANGFSSEIFSASFDAVDDSGSISPNTFSYNNTDIILDYLSLNISDPDYGFPSTNVVTENLDTTISDALTTTTVTGLGPATNVAISISQIASNTDVQFLANSTLLFDDVRISNYNGIGTIKVQDPGSGYSVGDEIIFTNTEYFSGQGAKGIVSAVNRNGAITRATVTQSGSNYKKEFLPTLSVAGSGVGANLVVEHFMGQDVDFDYVRGDGIPGKILSINILNFGKGYRVTPIIDLKFSGDGNATAVANLRPSFIRLPGRWINDDGFLSSDDVRLQGKDYYIDFSYVINSRVEFQRYRNIVKELLNPSGVINYAKFLISENIPTNLSYIVFDQFSRQLAGTVNVATGSSDVFGTNTYFEVAESIGLLSEGTYILVDSDIRIVNSIINNTEITVSQSYEFSGNDQTTTILTFPYNAITTEYWRELAITLEGPRTVVITTEE